MNFNIRDAVVTWAFGADSVLLNQCAAAVWSFVKVDKPHEQSFFRLYESAVRFGMVGARRVWFRKNSDCVHILCNE